ncbi:MAG: alpha/beta hydrolase-fold protein [Pseudomonadota bacterium]
MIVRALMALMAGAFLLANSAPEFAPLTIGETARVTVLGAEREINVILPKDYAKDVDKSWPVVVMIDGGQGQDLMMGVGVHNWNRLWGRSQEAIWIGIETKDRQRELLPPTSDAAQQDRYPTAGQGDAFRAWLVDQMLPALKARYRTNGMAFLVGESAAGHFVLETWFRQSDAFTGYAAISPSLQWDGQSLSKAIMAGTDVATAGTRAPLYFSLADEGGAFEEGVLRVAASLDPKQDWCFSDRRRDLKHSNSLHGLLPEALQYLMPTEADWLEEYGFTLRCDRSGRSPE